MIPCEFECSPEFGPSPSGPGLPRPLPDLPEIDAPGILGDLPFTGLLVNPVLLGVAIGLAVILGVLIVLLVRAFWNMEIGNAEVNED